jgi:hypothetical protein
LEFGGGYVNYDNFLAAVLSILQCLTLEDWSTQMKVHAESFNGIETYADVC